MAEHQGQQANFNGLFFELDIQNRLLSHGYAWCPTLPTLRTIPFFLRQYRGFRNLYGSSMKVDFYCWHPTKWPNGLIIEAKYQERGGSVDEKYPFLFASLKQTGIPALVLLIGAGPRPLALQWCLAQAQPPMLHVMTTLEEFLVFCNKGNL